MSAFIHHCRSAAITGLAIALTSSALLLSGCDSESNTNANANTGARASLGAISNATVNFYQADGSTLITSGETDASGEVRVPVSGYSGPVVIEVLGNDVEASYYDEAAAAIVSFAAGNSLYGLVSAPGQFVAVTPLTHLAYRGAVDQGLFPLTASTVNALNEIVRQALAPELSSILTPATAFTASTGANGLDNLPADRYALRLAALAQLGVSGSLPALEVLNALVADIADGQLDNVPPSGLYSNFANELAAALAQVANNFGTSALQNAVMNYPATSSTVDFSGMGGGNTGGDGGGDGEPNGVTSPATVAASLVASYNLVYTQQTSGGPFTDGQLVTAVVGSDNSLQINGKTLTNPFNRSLNGGSSFNTAEAIWLDSDDQIEYALTDNNSSQFNEINVGNATNADSTNGLPGFLGQLKLPVENNGGPSDAFIALAGSYSGQVVSVNNPLSTSYSANQNVPVVISADTGVVTVDGQYVFDPDNASYDFFDLTNNAKEPSYRVSVVDGDVTLRFDVGLGDGTSPVAFRLRQSTATGPGSAQVSTLEFEDSALPGTVSSLFTTLNNTTPTRLTVVAQSNGFTNGLQVCDTFDIATQNQPLESNSRNAGMFSYKITLPDASSFFGGENYRRFSTRYSASGNSETLRFGMRSLSYSTGDLIELKAEPESGATDRASNDPAAIAAAGCSVANDDPEVGNNGMSKCDGNCITGTLDGTDYTYAESMTVIVDVNDNSNAIIDARLTEGGTSLWRLRFGNAIGSYSCDDSGDLYTITHVLNGGFGSDSGNATDTGNCTIKVTQAGPIYAGYFTGTLERRTGLPNGALTNGYFYFDPTPSGSGGSGLPAGTNAATVNITEAGSSFAVGDSFLPTQSGSGNTRPQQVFANYAGDGITFFQLLGLEEGSTGTFACNAGPNGQFQALGMSLDFSYTASNPNGSCSVTVSSVSGKVYEGNYTGILTNSNGTDDVGVSGNFRFTLPD